MAGARGSGIRGKGEALLREREAESVDLDLAFESFPLEARGLLRGMLSGPLHLSGSRDALDLTGALALSELRLQIPESDDVAFAEIEVISSDDHDLALEIRERVDSASPLDPLRMDVSLAIPRNSWVRGRGAEVEICGELEASKERRLPLGLSGTVETVRGTYEIHGRRFRSERGKAVLDGSAEPDPVLDIRALHRVRGASSPSSMDACRSPVCASRASRSSARPTSLPICSSEGLRPPRARASSRPSMPWRPRSPPAPRCGGSTSCSVPAMPVDVVDVRVEQQGGKSAIHAGVGKYVGDRLFLHDERGFAPEPEDELKAGYELTDHWSVQSSVSAEGETGGDGIFEIEY